MPPGPAPAEARRRTTCHGVVGVRSEKGVRVVVAASGYSVAEGGRRAGARSVGLWLVGRQEPEAKRDEATLSNSKLSDQEGCNCTKAAKARGHKTRLNTQTRLSRRCSRFHASPLHASPLHASPVQTASDCSQRHKHETGPPHISGTRRTQNAESQGTRGTQRTQGIQRAQRARQRYGTGSVTRTLAAFRCFHRLTRQFEVVVRITHS